MDSQTVYTFLGLPDTQWKFINTFAPWLSAVGTIAAVIMSLYLALRDRVIKIRISAFFRKSKVESNTNYLVIYVTNMGHRTANIVSLYWKFGESVYVQESIEFINGSSDFPIILRDGEDARYLIDEDRFKFNFSNVNSDIPKDPIIIGVTH